MLPHSSATLLAETLEEEVEGSAILLPAIYDIFWSAVSFAIIFFFFWKWVLPQMKKALDARTEGIEDKLEQAEADRAEAAQMLADYKAQLADARGEAARIRSEAQTARESIVAEARNEAQDSARAATEQAQARLSIEVGAARSQLSREVGVLATQLAERIIGESLDNETTARTVDRFIADLEAAGEAVDDASAERTD